MGISEATLVIVVVQLVAFAYGYGKLSQKVAEINGEVKYQREYRHWANNVWTVVFHKLGLRVGPSGDISAPPRKDQ